MMETIDSSDLFEFLTVDEAKMYRDEKTLTSLQRSAKYELEVNQFIGNIFHGKGFVKDIASEVLIRIPRAIECITVNYNKTETQSYDVIFTCSYDASLKEKMHTINKSDSVEFSGIITKIIKPYSKFQFHHTVEWETEYFECVYLNLKSIDIKEPDKPPTNKNCFIATAVYGDINSEALILLRNYRDNKLLKTVSGELSVKIYYLISPFFARILSRSVFLKRIVKNYFLDPFVTKLHQKHKQ